MKASLRNLIETVDVKLRQRALFRADLVVTVSDAVGTIFEAAGLLGRPPSTVYNVPSPPRESPSKDASRGRWNIPPEAPIVLYVGKQSYGKGTDVLLDAARLVHREEPNVYFVLAGRTNSLIRVPQNDRFVVTGPLEHEEVLSLYAVADVVALPAVWKEPFPRSLIEAMSAARPVVASRTGGIPELVEDGETGLLVPPKDARALADALLLVLRSKETAEAMGQRGKARLERWFEAESGAKSLCAAYSRILGTTSTTGMEAR
jgi:glycosyltransferase involved in cell wall biosynthesis